MIPAFGGQFSCYQRCNLDAEGDCWVIGLIKAELFWLPLDSGILVAITTRTAFPIEGGGVREKYETAEQSKPFELHL